MTVNIHIPAPNWHSPIAGIILDLEKLRTLRLRGTVPPYIFFQLKNIFQMLETLGSARIEGNNTTLADYVEKIIANKISPDESRVELENIERAINFIEENTHHNTKIDRAYISQLHNIVTHGLGLPPKGEGSRYPGELRRHNVVIAKSNHRPPSHTALPDAFNDFIAFINRDQKEQDQLLMVAIAHHRFMYIHPFDNGNGRVGRLLTYAFLIKLGFNVESGRIINPSSVFYTDRDKYYDMLTKTDSLSDEDLLAWSEYFLSGLKNQIDKIDHLLQRDFTEKKILLPTIKLSLDREQITKLEHDILSMLIKNEQMTFKSSDLDLFGIETSQKKSYIRKKLQDKKMIQPVEEGGRVYTINFVNNYLLRGIVSTLKDNGFVADFLNNNI